VEMQLAVEMSEVVEAIEEFDLLLPDSDLLLRLVVYHLHCFLHLPAQQKVSPCVLQGASSDPKATRIWVSLADYLLQLHQVLPYCLSLPFARPRPDGIVSGPADCVAV
jgi:hypothetical protein